METKIAVSSMTNADSFLTEGPYMAIGKLKERGVSYIEISQHIQFNEETIPELLRALTDFDMKVAAISTQFYGNFASEPRKLFHKGMPLKTYLAERDFDELISLCQMLGCRYIRYAGLPCNEIHNMETLRAYTESAEKMACRFLEKGITLCVHNHTDEFILLEGKTLLDWSMELAPHLFYEIDVRNAQRAGADPAALIRKYGCRAALLHLQDQRINPAMAGELNPASPDYYQGAEIGQGIMNMQAIVDAAMEAGSEYLIIEQGKFYGRDPYESIDISVRALKRMMKRE